MGQDRTEHIDRVGCGRLALLECYYGKGAHAHRQPFTGAWFVAPPTVGPTRARRSYARKRPRLRPIYETVIAQVLGTEQLWEPLRVELSVTPRCSVGWNGCVSSGSCRRRSVLLGDDRCHFPGWHRSRRSAGRAERCRLR